MKSIKLAVRITDKEKERLEAEALAIKMSLSEYVRLKIFSEVCTNSISEQLSVIQESQKMQLKYLEMVDLRSKKHLRHAVILSASIFQIRYVTAKIIGMFSQVYSKSFPNLETANNKDKEDFIRAESEKVAQELEAFN